MINRHFSAFFMLVLMTVHLALANQASAQQNEDDLRIIKERLYNLYLNGNAPPNILMTETAEQLIDSLQGDGSWKKFDYKERPRLGLRSIEHLHRLVKIVRAYRKPGSSLYGSSILKEKIHLALNAWLINDPETTHHWFNEIGVPIEMAKLLILLENELTASELFKGIAIMKKANVNGVFKYGDSRATGQNMVWISRIQMEAGCLEGSVEYVKNAVNEFLNEITVTTMEGIQPDWSFHQHGPQLYSGGYGASFSSDCAAIAKLLRETSFKLGREHLEVLSHLILDGQQWMIIGSTWDYGTEGREISRMDKDAGIMAAACYDMAALNTFRRYEFISMATRILGYKPALEDSPEGNRHFWRSDFMVHRRDNYYTSVKMASDRIYGTESGNTEGIKNYHLGDGCTYLMKSGKEYRNIFPLWDWRKIPGVTSQLSDEALPLVDWGVKARGTTKFTGGVSDGEYGFAAFDLDKNNVKARKAWFYFDNEFVCLGAGISCTVDNQIVTSLNQCFRNGKIVVSDNKKQTNVAPIKQKTINADWIHHDGVAYIFPEKTKVTLLSETRTAGWETINRFSSKTRIEKGDIFSAWIENGTKPQNETYSYVIVPDIKLDKLGSYLSAVSYQVLSNKAALQAVQHAQLGILQIAFWEKGEINFNKKERISVDKPCLLMYRQMNSAVVITVSNPENEAMNLVVEITARLKGDNCIWDETKKRSVISISLPSGEYAGQSVSYILARSRE